MRYYLLLTLPLFAVSCGSNENSKVSNHNSTSKQLFVGFVDNDAYASASLTCSSPGISSYFQCMNGLKSQNTEMFDVIDKNTGVEDLSKIEVLKSSVASCIVATQAQCNDFFGWTKIAAAGEDHQTETLSARQIASEDSSIGSQDDDRKDEALDPQSDSDKDNAVSQPGGAI